MPAPVCGIDLYHDGGMCAYAVGYDWSHCADENKYGSESKYVVRQNIEERDMDLTGSTNNRSIRGSGHRNRLGRGGYIRGPG